MEIPLGTLKEIARIFLSVLEQEKINFREDLEERLRTSVILNDSTLISIESRPSNNNTFCYTLSYTIEKVGIPIELRINPLLNYTMIILKAQERIDGYEQFALDSHSNIVQSKLIKSSDFSVVRKELENIYL